MVLVVGIVATAMNGDDICGDGDCDLHAGGSCDR